MIKGVQQKVLRAGMGIMAGLFVWAAALQLNDEDGWIWVIIYLVGAVMSGLAAFGRPMPKLAGRLVFFTFMGAMWLGITAFSPSATKMFEYEENTGWKIVDTEEGRESGGLALISATLLVIVRKWPLLQKSSGASSDEAEDQA